MLKQKNYAIEAYNKSTKLEKEKVVKDNYLYAEKLVKFSLPKTTLYSFFNKSFSFNCEEESFVNLFLHIKTDKEVNVKIYLNKVLYFNQNTLEVNINNIVNVTKHQTIDINISSNEMCEIEKYLLKIKGNVKDLNKSEKRLIKGTNDFIQNVAIIDNRVLYGKYQNINDLLLGFTSTLNDSAVFGLVDADVFYLANNSNPIQECYLLIKNNQLMFRFNDVSVTLFEGVPDCCAISYIYSSQQPLAQVVYVLDNVITILKVKTDGSIYSTSTLNHNIKSHISQVGMFTNLTHSENAGMYFITASNDLYVSYRYGAVNDFTVPFKCGTAKYAQCFLSGNDVYIFMYLNNCLALHKFLMTTSNDQPILKRLSVNKFYNCDYGFVNNDKVYVVCNDLISEVDIV